MDPLIKAMLKNALEDAFKDSVGRVFDVMIENNITGDNAYEKAKAGYKDCVFVYQQSLLIVNQMDTEGKTRR
jgi:hypothetical protein